MSIKRLMDDLEGTPGPEVRSRAPREEVELSRPIIGGASDLAISAPDRRRRILDDVGLGVAARDDPGRWAERSGIVADIHGDGPEGGRAPSIVEAAPCRILPLGDAPGGRGDG